MLNKTRKLKERLREALKVSPVVYMNGPRQAGKSTLANELGKEMGAEYVTFDNPTLMAAASSAPSSFLGNYEGRLIIDEVQLVKEVFRALKISVDELRLGAEERIAGKYFLTGSANIMALPKLSEPLVGRMSVLTLYPFSVSEVVGTSGDFISRIFSGDFSGYNRKEIKLEEAMKAATYPEISGEEKMARDIWFDGYLSTILMRDVKMLSEVEKLGSLQMMLKLLAARSGSLLNEADIARGIGFNPVTSKQYRKILDMMFLTFELKPWFRNIGKRLVKSPKVYILDTLLMCHLLDISLDELWIRDPGLFGHVLENFVASELTKLLSFSKTKAKLYYYRTSDGKEVDFILEQANGRMVGIELKSKEVVKPDDFRHIKGLMESVGNDMEMGVVLYTGKEVVSFGEKLFAVPVGMLWS